MMTTTKTPQRIRDRLAGQHILVTGSTGFLAKAFVEKLLRSVDSIASIHLLVRGRSSGSTPQQRVMREVLGSRAFDRLRASHGDGFTRLCEEKIEVVGGDLTEERFGLDPKTYEALAARITLVVNSAATVTFDERIDLAIDLNTMGPSRLLRFAKDSGNIPFMHVSTCYVCGARDGHIVEDFSAPESARETMPRLKPGGAFDIDGLIETIRGEAAEVRHRFGADSEMCRRELIEAGMRRARSLGWSDTYTFTKWLGEQRLIRDRGDVPLAIFRPAIIESSYDEPIPGWIDGLRMADPIIVAYGKGKLNEFPGLLKIALDLIPVDFVANAMVATLPVGEAVAATVPVYQCASSERNPLYLSLMQKALQRAYRQRPMNDDKGRPVRVGRLQLVDRHTFMRRWRVRLRRITRLQSVYKVLGITGKRYRRLSAIARQIEQVIYFAKIYWPYTHLDCRFADDALRAVEERLHPKDLDEFPFDVRRVDWTDYLVNRHVPGIRSFVLGTGGEPTQRILAADEAQDDPQTVAEDALGGANLFEMFRRSAERFGSKPALQIRRHGRWVRYTYEEVLAAAGAITRRFSERGLQPGDRVAICGESGPEWGLTYVAAMRAGLTAIPLDPQLPPTEAWSAARFADAKLMCAAPGTMTGLQDARGDDDPELVLMREPFIPRPGASRDPAPPPASTHDTAIASILFTSGTTVRPKAVQLTHRNLMANARALVAVHPVTPSDQLLSVLPMYHAFEFTGGFLVPMVCGATITYIEQLKGPELQSAMQATGTTVMLVVPRLLRMLNDSIERTVAASGRMKRAAFGVLGVLSDWFGRGAARTLFGSVHKKFGGHLRMFVSGGSKLDPDLFAAFERLGFEVYEGYGLTETAPVLTVNRTNDAQAGSVGPPLPGIEIEIRGDNLEGIGEVWARGESIMAGYLKDDDATREVLVDGWFRTGDLGRMGDGGRLVLTGRSKDLIVTDAGKNVYPDEVETHYADLPHTKEVCVFGMASDDGLGDTVHAVVVIDGDTDSDLDRSSMEREIRTAAAAIGEALPSHQRIATLHFWERDLPKTSTLKAKRNLIRDMVRAERSGAAPPAASATDSPEIDSTDGHGVEASSASVEAILAILASHSERTEDAIRRNMHLHLDLGIDSIGKMDVIGSVEARFGMQIDGEKAAKIARVGDLFRLVAGREPKKGTQRTTSAPSWTRASTPSVGSNGHSKLPTALIPMRWLVRGGVAAVMHTYVRVHAVGRENIPETGPFLLAPNHSSHLDSPSVVTAVGGKRRVWIAGAEDYFFNNAMKRLVFGKMLDTIPFDRHADGLMGLRRCAEALGRGDGLLMFPEGTRSTTGELQAFKIGVAVLAMEQQAPIVPVYLDRAFDLWPKGQRFVKPGAITVHFGKPIMPPPGENGERYAGMRVLAKQIEDAVVALANGATA